MQICIVNLLLYIVLYGEKYFDYQYEKSEIIIRRTYFSGWDICLLQQSGAKSGQQTGRSATLGGYTKFKEVLSPCNCPRGLKTTLSYLTIEPSLRFRPFKKGLYLYAGPRISYLLDKSFVYSQRNDPANADQTPIDDIRGDFDAVNKVVYSMQIGAGYDILLSNNTHRAQFVLSPFVAFLPYFGQNPRR